MAVRVALSVLCAAAFAAFVPPSAAAQDAESAAGEAETASGPTLGEELAALAKARLMSVESASAEQLRALVAEGERLSLAGQHDDATLLLLEALESPRFADYREFPEYAAAEHMAGGALLRTGSLLSARRYLERAIARGRESPYYGPAVRRYTDVALMLFDMGKAADWLATQRPRSEDAEFELTYLRARADYDKGAYTEAGQLLSRIGKKSRFYGNAQYLLGVIETKRRRMRAAEQRFCAVATAGVLDRYTFYVDDRFFEVQDLARLALGRTAHETHRGDDAFYYYFQVPRDSPRLPEALFEAAYASYEAEDHETALDLLEQLEANYPDSAFVDEAAILRGYVALARCEFDRADGYFQDFVQHFSPLLAHIERLLENRARRERLYEALLANGEGREPAQKLERTLFALLRVDPDFYRLHRQVAALDAEAARASRVSDGMDVVHARLLGSDRPRPTAAPESDAATPEALLEDIERAETLTRALSDDLDALRASRAKPAALALEEKSLSALAERVHDLRTRARLMRAAPGPQSAAAQGKPLPELLARDAEIARKLPARVEAVRGKLVRAAGTRAESALRDLRDRLSKLLRRARIGRIDAVMGSKRRVELQIESLAAGRFPAELRDPLRVQGLLDDDEEYWPFEGEDWPDEYEENYRGDEGGPGGAQVEAER